MRLVRRTATTLLILCLLLPLLPARAEAASVVYWESVKDGVPLRHAAGSGNPIVSRISAKGTVVTQIDSYKLRVGFLNWHTWYKVHVEDETADNRQGGDYWVYCENLTKHKRHTLAVGSCTVPGCPYRETERTLSLPQDEIDLEVVRGNAPLRMRPYNDGTIVQRLETGHPLTAVAKIRNYKGSVWYQVNGGNYIFSENVTKATREEINRKNNSYLVIGERTGNAVTPTGFRPYEKLPCLTHMWSAGVCVNCGAAFPLNVESVHATYLTNRDNVDAKSTPYKQGAVMKTYPSKDSAVTVTGQARNSAKNLWYRTTDGYWIYSEYLKRNISLQDAWVSINGDRYDGYTFSSMTESIMVSLACQPANAIYTQTQWASDNPNVAQVNAQGVVTPKAVGKAHIYCTVESAEGKIITARMEVNIPRSTNLEIWTHSSQTFDYDLALECSEYMALAYPDYNYTVAQGNLLVYKTANKPAVPQNLTRLLNARGMESTVSNNYYHKTTDNSPYVIADKLVKYQGRDTPVIYVIIEGSAGLAGWQGNMMVSGISYSNVREHQSFSASAQDIARGLTTYITKYGDVKPLLVITGHSRGAAVANLLAESLNHSDDFEEIYAYTFATPNATRRPASSANIYNICNTDDFVTHIPFSYINLYDGWGFQKHGNTLSFHAGTQYRASYSFRSFIRQEMILSAVSGAFFRTEPDYSYVSRTPSEMDNYIVGKWKTLESYYHLDSVGREYFYDMEAYDYFFNGLASAASGRSDGIDVITEHLHFNFNRNDNCAFTPISVFFAGNGIAKSPVSLLAAFADSHEAYTYHSAMLSGLFGGGNSANLSSVEGQAPDETRLNGDTPAALNSEEYQLLRDFFTQDENELMLEAAGWNASDASTWTGVRWDEGGHIVDLDISYLNLSGWLDVTSLPELRTLNIDGNFITMLGVEGCGKLEELDCLANNLPMLSVSRCENLQRLDCAFNRIDSLDVSGLGQLRELNCYGNEISALNLSGATALETVRCGGNNLQDVDISTNTSLSTFYCEGNYIVESQNAELAARVSAMNEAGGSAVIGAQKYIDGYGFNESELSNLTAFANSALNLEKLGWDLDDPWNWNGVEWKIYGDEYHIVSLTLDGLDLEGDLNLPETEYLESLSCSDSSLHTLGLSGCARLTSVNCYSAGLDTLEIADCEVLSSLNCDKNYLVPEEIAVSLNQLGLQTGVVNYEQQNIAEDESGFHEHERGVLIDFLSVGNNAEVLNWDWDWPGTWSGITWERDEEGIYRVSKIDFSEFPVTGSLDLTGFDYLDSFCFRGTQIEEVILPDCIVTIPENAFYNCAVRAVYLSDGVSVLGEQSFACCENLETMVLPASVSKIGGRAFYRCSNLQNVVFLGDEPLEIGPDIFAEISPSFTLHYMTGRNWNADSELLDSCVYEETAYHDILICEKGLSLTQDDAYSMENQYSGSDVTVAVISSETNVSRICFLAVYDENGAMVSVDVQGVELNRYMNEITFHDVNLQYVGEEFCQVGVFVTDDSLIPTAFPVKEMLSKTS